ncbi:MAG: hypothetical protein WAN50_01295 [Minisyncoccia bacterium]
MSSKLVQLQKRIADLEVLADEAQALAERLSKGEKVQPDLSVKGQRWYRGAREILVQANSSALEEFDQCYDTSKFPRRGNGIPSRRSYTDIGQYINIGTNSYHEANWPGPGQEAKGHEYLGLFSQYFSTARALLLSVVEEVLSRELPVKTQLSFEVAADEFATAETIFKNANGEEVFYRVSGMIARVALERHLFTVADDHGVKIAVNPPGKKKADVQDVITSLKNSSVISPIQQSQLESLFKVGNNCAHPKEQVIPADVERLIREARALAAIIL